MTLLYQSVSMDRAEKYVKCLCTETQSPRLIYRILSIYPSKRHGPRNGFESVGNETLSFSGKYNNFSSLQEVPFLASFIEAY